MARRALSVASVTALALLSGCAGTSAMVTRVRINSTPRCSDFVFPVYFAGRSAELTPAAVQVINKAGAHIAGCTVSRVEVLGLAGFRDPAPGALELPRLRAERVAAASASHKLQTRTLVPNPIRNLRKNLRFYSEGGRDAISARLRTEA